MERRTERHQQTLYEGNGDEGVNQRLDAIERTMAQLEARRDRMSARLWTLGLSILTTVILATLLLLWRLSMVMQTGQGSKFP